MQKAAFLTLALVSAVAFAQNDSAAYKSAHDKAEATYKTAKKQCDALKDNAQDVCEEEAKVARAQSEREAVAQHKNTAGDLQKADRKLAEARYELAKEKCDDLSGNAKDACQAQARSTRASANLAATGDGRTGVLVNNTERSTVAANAADVRDRTAAAADRMGDRTAVAAANAKEKTAEVAQATKEKTSQLVDATKEKTSELTQRAKNSDVAQSAREKTAGATGNAQAAMSDTMITAKVKADMAADRTVKAMDVHVETQQGVVMLSGFVPSKTEADRAVQLARGVKGVTEVKSSIQVK